MEKKKKRRTLENIILVIAIGVFLFSGFQLYQILSEYNKGEEEYGNLQDLVVKENTVPLDKLIVDTEQDANKEMDEEVETEQTKDPEPEQEEVVVFDIDFDKLKSINEDVVAWIRFDNPSIISYPVVLSSDNEEYLHETFEGNKNAAGTLFVDYKNKGDFEEENTFIYGHNMRNDSMFGALPEYKSQSFCEANPYFYIYLPDGRMVIYQVFAVGIVKDTSQVFDKSYADAKEFQKYISLIRQGSLYDTDVEVTEDSKIVSLTTCTNVKDDERLVVHGVKISEMMVGE